MTEDRKEAIETMNIESLWRELRNVNDWLEEFVIEEGSADNAEALHDLFAEQNLIESLIYVNCTAPSL